MHWGGKINSLNAQETITIGSGDKNSMEIPIWGGGYEYTFSQQIYKASELNHGAGVISSIAFKSYFDNSSLIRTLEVFLMNTSDEVMPAQTYLMTDITPVFSGDVTFGEEGTWTTINFQNNFSYEGGNIVVCVNDITQETALSSHYFYTYQTDELRSISKRRDNTPYDMGSFQTNTSHMWGTYCYKYNNQIQFTFGAAAPAEPSLTVSEESIDLGNVRMCWTEKPVSETFNVVAENTTVTGVTCDNTFFEVVYESGVVTVSYDNTVDVSGEQTGTITIAAEGAIATVDVSATAYTPAEVVKGDVYENPITVTFDANNSFTAQATGMYDDYILPDETVDGNLNDAVYKFTLANDALITATVEGTNPIVAIYDEGFGKKDGPSFDNNNTGVQSGPTAPTTFGPYTFDDASQLEDNFEYDNTAWAIYNNPFSATEEGKNSLTGSKIESRLVTKTNYAITSQSRLTFSYNNYSSGAVIVVELSTNGVDFETKAEISATGNQSIDLSDYSGQEVYISIMMTVRGYGCAIDNLALTDGSAKSRASEPQIDGVQYPAGTYYLVAAAEGNFTLNLRKVDYIAIDAPQVVVDGGSILNLNKYVGETITLEWPAVEGVDGYRVYKGEDVLAELENNTYEIELNEYNITPGYTFYVTAYIGENESPKSEPIYVKVSGKVDINGTLTNGAGATLTFTGTDEFGETQTYTPEVGNDGSYTIEDIKAGHYTMTASKFDYQDFSAEIDIVYSVESVTLERAMVEKPAAGNAIYSVSMSETQSGATVSWVSDFSSANYNQKYNIYRKDVENGDVTPIVENQTLSNGWNGSYADATYSSLPDGKSYQYGVTAIVAGEPVEVMREGFENNGSLPQGWERSGSCGVTSTWGYYNTGSYGFYFSYGSSSSLTSPVIDLSAYSVAPIISFYCKNSDATNLNLYVKTSDSNNWNWVAGFNSLGSFAKQSVTLPDSYKGKNIQIKFEYPDNGTSWPCIDDIEISVPLSAESKAVWSTPLKKGLNTFTNKADGDDWNKWEVAANWSKGLPTSESEVIINGSVQIASDVIVKSLSVGSGSVVINNNASLTVTDEMVNNTSYKLAILDGGQLKQHSSDVKAVFSMNIVAPQSWSSNDSQYNDGWQFIASPFTNADISFFTYNAVYDLYRYNGSNQGEEWINHKDNEDAYTFETNFENGVGYLASRQNGGAVSFTGTLNNKTSFEKPLSYTEGKPLANFHLLGNPFSFNMDWDNVDLVNVYDGFATVDPATGGYVKSVGKGIIPVGDGFFVEATGENPSISYPAQSKSRGENDKADYINVIATGAEGSNNLIVKFSGAEEKGFSKLENINPNIADIYVVNNGRQYSILGYDRDVQEIALNFDAKQMGNYSISLDINGKFENVTLVDRFTGIETNMLIEDEYSFTATSNESHERFFIRLDNGQESTADSQFVFQSGEELILSIEGTVQIVDMLGRVVYSNDHSNGNNRISVSEFNNAAYVVRVINEEGVKVQKVVIY